MSHYKNHENKLISKLYGSTASVVTKYYCFGIWCFNEINFIIYLKFLIKNEEKFIVLLKSKKNRTN